MPCAVEVRLLGVPPAEPATSPSAGSWLVGQPDQEAPVLEVLLCPQLLLHFPAGGWGRRPPINTPSPTQGPRFITSVVTRSRVAPLSSQGTFIAIVSSNFILKQLWEVSLQP